MKRTPHFFSIIFISSAAILGAREAMPKATPEKVQSPSERAALRVGDFGALGDGIHDDGPAIAAAFEAAKADGVPSTVVFGEKIYRLGDNPTAWHYFQMSGHEDLVIDGGGATLLCPEGSLAFYFEGGRNITVRGITFDIIKPAFTQGAVVAVDDSGSLDVKIMEGYPEPPDEAFLTANGHEAHGGGGRHMIVFENGGGARNTRMGNDHLYIRNITRVSPGVFRFHVKEDYVPSMKGMVVGNLVSYAFNKDNLLAAVVAAKDKSASTYAQIAANRVENITFEKLDIFGSLNGGIRVSDMHDDVTLREVRIIRKPGTRNLLFAPLAATCVAAESTLPAKADAQSKKTQNFLFIGNSFTMRHELPTLFAALAQEGFPGRSAQTEIVGYGGKNLFQHWECYRSYNRLNVSGRSASDLEKEIRELTSLDSTKEEPAFYAAFWQELSATAFYRKFTPKTKSDWEADLASGRSLPQRRILKRPELKMPRPIIRHRRRTSFFRHCNFNSPCTCAASSTPAARFF